MSQKHDMSMTSEDFARGYSQAIGRGRLPDEIRNETDVVATIVCALSPLDERKRQRVLKAAMVLLGIEGK